MMTRYRVPGMAFGVLFGGKREAAAFGVTSLTNPLPVTTDTLFQVGSISKTVLGTAAMRLVEQGKLDLDAPIRIYLPNFKLKDKNAAANATMRHLFTHTGGWLGDYFNDIGWADDALARMLDLIAELPQMTPLGELFSYNNAGFNIAGRVIEVITGQPYEQAIKALVFDPLQMNSSMFFPWDVLLRRFAVGHISPHDVTIPSVSPVMVASPWALGRSSHPAAGVLSTINDMLTYAEFHLGDGKANGKRVLRKSSLQQMHTAQVKAYSSADHWGLTWAIRNVGDMVVVRHGGATRGFTADLRMVPDANLALITLTNSDRGSELYDELSSVALQQFLGLEIPELETIALVAKELPAWVGDYDAPLDLLKVRKKGGQLTIQSIPKGGFPNPDTPPTGPALAAGMLAFESADRATVLDGGLQGSRVEVLRDANGAVQWLHVGGRAHKRV